MIDRVYGRSLFYVCSAYYESEHESKLAWEQIQRQMMPGPDTALGVVRLRPHPRQGAPDLMTAGAPFGKWIVAATTFNHITATAVELLMRGGTSFTMNPEFADVLIRRNIQQRVAHAGEGDRVVRRRDPERGAEIDGFGNVHELP